jgi:transposase
MYGFRHERIDHGKRFANGKVYINGIEGFGVMLRRGF